MFVNLQIGLILPCRTGVSVTGIPVVGVADTLLASPPIFRLKESISQLICVTHKITKSQLSLRQGPKDAQRQGRH